MSGLEFEQVDPPAEAVRIHGRVKWFDAGKGYGFIIPDDPSQTDLPRGEKSGLADAVDTLSDVEGIRFVRLSSKDVVRHDLVTRIVDAYDARDKKIKG